MRKKLFLFSEICGAFAVCAATVALSFVYRLADGNVLGVLFGAANSSVWERVKLSALAFIAYAAVELILCRPPVGRFTFSKTAGVIVLTLLMTVCYTLGGVPTFSVGIIFICSLAGFAVSYTATRFFASGDCLLLPSALMLLLIVIVLFCFTVAPPHLPIFADAVTGMYGVIPYFHT